MGPQWFLIEESTGASPEGPSWAVLMKQTLQAWLSNPGATAWRLGEITRVAALPGEDS